MNCSLPLAGVVKDPEKFYDRENEIKEIVSLLENRQNVAVVGESEIGKSSILWKIYKEAQQGKILKNFNVIFIDIQGVDTKEELLKKILNELKIAVKNDNYEALKSELEEAVKHKKIILILDEFDKVKELAGVFDKSFRGWLRSLTQERSLTLVISTRREPSILFPDSGITSPFYNIFLVRKILPFDKNTVKNYAQKFGISPDKSNEIFSTTEGRPKKVNFAIYSVCMWDSDSYIKSQYRSWRDYYSELISKHEPPETSVKQFLSATWLKINKVALFILGFLGTAIIVDEPLLGLMRNVFHTNQTLTGKVFWFYLILLILISLSGGLILASLGLEAVIKIISLIK